MAKNAISLKTELKLSSDFYTHEEAKGFKKRKRKVKKSKPKGGMTLMDDTLERRDFETPLGEKEPQTSFGSRSWKREGKDSTKSENKEDDADVKQETVIEDSVKKDTVVLSSLERTRRLLKS